MLQIVIIVIVFNLSITDIRALTLQYPLFKWKN